MNTKIEIFLQFLFAVLAVTSAINHSYPDCIRNSDDEILIELMSPFKSAHSCRRGHKLVEKSSSMFCCDTIDFSAVQTPSSDEFMAFQCSNTVAPKREDLLINGDDLMCQNGEELKVFEVKVRGRLVEMACCGEITFWPWSKWFFSFRSAPPFLLKGSSSSSDSKPLLKASNLPMSINECYFNDPSDKVNPLVDYMTKDQEGLSCRTNQIMLTSTKNDENYYCCRYSSTSTLFVAEVLAPECVFENGELLSLHGRTPGNDLNCKDKENYELITQRTRHMVYDKSVVLQCCKKIETTTTSTTTPLPIPTVKEGDVCVKAGNDCVYHPDGTIKVNYMDFASKGAVCRHGQITRVETDYKSRVRVCCETSPNAPRLNIPPVCATTCSFTDVTDISNPLRWSIMNYSDDLICRPDFHIARFNTAEGEKCCCLDDILTTTTTTTTTTESTTTTSESSTTTKESTTTSSSALTTSQASTSSSALTTSQASTTSTVSQTTTSQLPTTSTTKPPTEEFPSAATACNYDSQKRVLTNLMEVCNAQTLCRANEVKKTEILNGKEHCCCDFRKDLPPPSENDPKLIAPKCYYDQDGNMVPFSALPAGLDLICKTTDTMVTNKDEKEAISCCVLRNVTTTTSTTTTSTTQGPSTSSTTQGAATTSTTQGGTTTSTTQGAVTTTTGFSTTVTTIPTNVTTTKSPRKRTPKSIASRVVKDGECPDCIMPKSAQEANINWVIAHLERPGPPMGRCPSGYTMRRIYPVVERKDLTATKCCCESDAFPLPVKLGG